MSDGVFLVSSAGVKSFQAADYNTYYALAEIIDNSISANAKNIHIIGVEESLKNKDGKLSKKLNEIIIYDDGDGMTEEVANLCLQLGGGTHIGTKDKKQISKFGMGLPQASGSQCMKTEVFTWRKPNEIFYTYLDYEEICKKEPPMLPKAKKLNNIPIEILNLINTTIKEGLFAAYSKSHGTIIRWNNCNRLDHKTYSAFYRNFELFNGRVYRYFIQDENRCISVSGFEKLGNTFNPLPNHVFKKIRVNDPMFLMKNNIIGDYQSEFANQATNIEYGKEINQIEIDNKKFDIRIKFSYCKDEVRDFLGRGNQNPGSTKLGELYGKNLGISLLRAGRELKLNTFGFIGDFSKTTNRWWSVEVEFQPELDDYFGVTFDKQEAKAFRFLDKEVYTSELEDSGDMGLKLMYEITQKISANIDSMDKLLTKQTAGRKKNDKLKKCIKCGEITLLKNECTSCGFRLDYCAIHTDQKLINNQCSACIIEPKIPNDFCTKHNKKYKDNICDSCENEHKSKQPDKVMTVPEEERLRGYLITNFYEYRQNKNLLDGAIEYFKKGSKSYFPIYSAADPVSFVSYSDFGDITFININTNHPFYTKFIEVLLNDPNRNENDLIPIQLLIGSIIHAQKMFIDENEKEVLNDFLGNFARSLKTLMNKL